MKKLFMLELITEDGKEQATVYIGETGTEEEAQEYLNSTEAWDFTDRPQYVYELGTAWDARGKGYEINLEEAKWN